MSLPQFIEGCPQHETLVRHKQRHRSRTVSKTSESTQPLTLLPHKTHSKLQSKHSANPANPGFEGAQAFQGGNHQGKKRKKVQGGGPGGSRGGPEVLGGKTAKTPEKRSGTWLAYYAATSRILCRRFP